MKEITVEIYDINWRKPEVDECDWHCDSCDASLNDQDGFDAFCGTWECTECGYINTISEDEIRLDLPENVVVTLEGDEYYIESLIEDYLVDTYDNEVDDYRYIIYNDDEENDEDDEDEYGERISDSDYELANICRGGDLDED